MPKKMDDKKWDELELKNAKHRTHIHLDAGQPHKIAEALKDIPVAIALQHLFELAEEARLKNKTKRAMTILEAVALIDRKTGQEMEISLKEEIRGKDTTAFVYIEKKTPAEVFAEPISNFLGAKLPKSS